MEKKVNANTGDVDRHTPWSAGWPVGRARTQLVSRQADGGLTWPLLGARREQHREPSGTSSPPDTNPAGQSPTLQPHLTLVTSSEAHLHGEPPGVRVLTYEFGDTHIQSTTDTIKFLLKLTDVQNPPTYPRSCFQGK